MTSLRLRSSLPLVLASALVAGASAQNISTIPSDHTSVNGFRDERNIPFASGANRCLMVFESSDLLIPAGRTISRIGFRLDDNRTGAAAQIVLEMFMGQTMLDSRSLSSSFATNYSGARTQVKNSGVVSLPAVDASNQGMPLWFNLDTPFTYDPSQNLLVEFVVTFNNQGNTSFQYPLDRADFLSPQRNSMGGACMNSAGTLPSLTSSPVALGSTWTISGSNFPANSFGAVILAFDGLQATGLPLISIIPGADPSCAFFVNTVNAPAVSSSISASGRLNLSIPLPNDPSLSRVPLTVQGAALDFFVPGQVVLSNAHEMTVGFRPRIGTVTSSGGPTSTSGSARFSWGIVTLFDHN